MKTGNKSKLFLNKLQHLGSNDLTNSKLETFVILINSNRFDYNSLADGLLESTIDYALSRKTKEKYKDDTMKLSQLTRERFKEKMNTGELGEFLLFSFLEGHLNAPKILTKMELKTNKQMYVHGADGVHFLELENGNFQLIFGESKMHSTIKSGIRDAFKSISEFVTADHGERILFEKSLIDSHIEQETFTKKQEEFIETLIYPSKNNIIVDDAFGVFIGFEIEVTEDARKLSNSKYRDFITNKIKELIDNHIDYINQKITENDLDGYNFYFYLLPFEDIDLNRTRIIERLTQ